MIARAIDRVLIAPNATPGERVVVYSTAVVGVIGASLLAADAGLSTLAVVVIGLFGFDLFGGAVANSTLSAKRLYFGPTQTHWHHLGFVAIHVQPFIFAWVGGYGWWNAAALYALALIGAVVIVMMPPTLRRPAAFAWVALSLLVPLDPPAALVWVAPVLLIKLLLAHLQPDGVSLESEKSDSRDEMRGPGYPAAMGS